MPKRIHSWFTDHPNLFAFLLVTVVFVFTVFSFTRVVDRQAEDAHKRKIAFCGLVYLFDQSIKLRGNEDLGPLQKPYDDWKEQVDAVYCPKKPDIAPVPTTTTIAE